MTPSSQELESPGNPGRFTLSSDTGSQTSCAFAIGRAGLFAVKAGTTSWAAISFFYLTADLGRSSSGCLLSLTVAVS